LLLLGIVWLESLTGPVEFTVAGAPTEIDPLFWLAIGGLAVKAALVPPHGRLPTAMVAPAPAACSRGGEGGRLWYRAGDL
jgi:multicomponent Na+:H+ antiporter subunit D